MEQPVFKPELRRRWRSFTRNIPLPDCLEDNRIAIAIRPELRRKSFLEIIHPDDRDRARAELQAALAKGEAHGLIFRINFLVTFITSAMKKTRRETGCGRRNRDRAYFVFVLRTWKGIPKLCLRHSFL